MAASRDLFDLASLRLAPGEGRRTTLHTHIEPLMLGSERYLATPDRVPLQLEVSRMIGGGYALRVTFSAAVSGPCMRCLKDAAPVVEVDAREVEASSPRASEDEELDSPYVVGDTLDLGAWAHDAFALALPAKVLCRDDCPGLCPVCAADLATVGSDHVHDSAPDPRWAKLGELRLQ